MLAITIAYLADHNILAPQVGKPDARRREGGQSVASAESGLCTHLHLYLCMWIRLHRQTSLGFFNISPGQEEFPLLLILPDRRNEDCLALD